MDSKHAPDDKVKRCSWNTSASGAGDESATGVKRCTGDANEAETLFGRLPGSTGDEGESGRKVMQTI